jgi:predicted hydrolase (HD superfamily)
MISEKAALGLVRNSSKYAHVLVVSAMMGGLARTFNDSVREWRLVGLLHDLDYDQVRGDITRHGILASEKLKDKLPKNCIYAIKAHDHRAGIKPQSRLDKALVATDSLAVLIEKITGKVEKLSPQELLAEIEKASVPRPWLKDNMLKCHEIGLTLDEFLNVCLNSLKRGK